LLQTAPLTGAVLQFRYHTGFCPVLSRHRTACPHPGFPGHPDEESRQLAIGMVGAPRLRHTGKEPPMDADTEKLIREVWSDLATGLKHTEARLSSDANSRFNRIESRFDKLEACVDTLAGRFDKLEARVAKLEARVAKLEAEFEAFRRVVIENFARVQRNFELLLAEVRDPVHKARLDRIEERLARLELHIGLPSED
jgi:SMC interacting uncharacterized protein involved in chromosome segregation